MKISVPSALSIVGLFAFTTTSNGAELKIMSPVAFKPVLTTVAANFQKMTGDPHDQDAERLAANATEKHRPASNQRDERTPEKTIGEIKYAKNADKKEGA